MSGEDVLVADVVIRVPRLCQRLPNVVEPSGDEPGSAFTPDGSVNRTVHDTLRLGKISP